MSAAPIPSSMPGSPRPSRPSIWSRGSATDTAVDGVSFTVPQGTVLGLLGPNGAGKTTTVRMMTTLTEPTSGTARVAGYDVRTQPDMVRRNMGLTGQVATVDELLTGRENIRMIGGLYGIRRRDLARLGDQLLEQFSIADAADRPVSRTPAACGRRLDLAVSLIASPPVLFLDEPTTGLDPAQPQRPVGGAARAGRRGHHAAADHAVPRGGRPTGRQHRRDGPRAGSSRRARRCSSNSRRAAPAWWSRCRTPPTLPAARDCCPGPVPRCTSTPARVS